MKAFLLSLLLLPVAAQANTIETVFKKDSPIGSDLQRRILAEVSAKCSRGLVRNGMTEEYTKVSEVIIDQGVHDFLYTTTFRTTYYFDGMHPTFAFIEVESAEYMISNPGVDRLEIKSIKADADICQ